VSFWPASTEKNYGPHFLDRRGVAHTLDQCVGDGLINEAILPLMRDCFFGGAMHAVLLLQKGYGDRLASDIARYIRQEPQLPPKFATER